MANRTFVIVQDPQDKLDYKIDWSALGTDTIFTSVWDVPVPLTQPNSPSKTDTSTTVWLAGGVLGAEYTVINHIVTTGGRELDAVLIVRMKEKF